MNYATPLIVRDGRFYDRFFNPLSFNTEDVHIPSAGDLDLNRFVRSGINMIRLFLDDVALTDASGRLTNNDALEAMDNVLEQACQMGIYVTLLPVTTGKASCLDAALFTRQQRYFSELFTRRSALSGRRLYEYENIAAIEILFDLTSFEDPHFELYCGRVMMEVFIDHYFNQRVRKIYSLANGEPTDSQLASMERHHIQLVKADVFEKNVRRDLQFDPIMPGIPESVVRGYIRHKGDTAWSSVAVSDAMSITEHPHANGGAEGWLTYAADVPIELRLEFPYEVKTATFRPSMQDPIEAIVHGASVELTLPSARYGALEVNYQPLSLGGEEPTWWQGAEHPTYTVYILGDPVAEDPADASDTSHIKFIQPGRHALSDVAYDGFDMIYFLPGVHEIEGEKIPMQSNCDVYIPRRAVVRAGVIAEEVENATISGQGVLDGSTSPRDVGENKGERMGEKWSDDAGREGFVCFFKGCNITFDGPVIYNSNYWNIVISGTKNAVVRNHKAITWLQNTDGIQPRSCTNLLVERCFLKCADDCVAVKTRRTLAMESSDLVFRDLVLWHDRVGNGLEIGHTSQADLLENVTFSDIRSIYGGGSGGCLSIHIIDHSTVKNVLFEDLYIEGRPYWLDFTFTIHPSYYTSDNERGHIKGVTIRNYYCDHAIQPGHIKGYDPDHLIEDVSFEECYWHYRNEKKRHKVSDLTDLLKENKFTNRIRIVN